MDLKFGSSDCIKVTSIETWNFFIIVITFYGKNNYIKISFYSGFEIKIFNSGILLTKNNFVQK